MTQLSIPDMPAMLILGAKLAQGLRAGDVLAVKGDLGAGKTTLIRGMIQAFLPDMVVPSPTYTLVQTYDLPNFEFWHCDLYRLEHPNEVYELGLMDAMGEAVCVLEWPDRMGDLLPKTALEIEIIFEGEGRLVRLQGWEGRDV